MTTESKKLISVDTNILFTACNPGVQDFQKARCFLLDHYHNQQFVLCEGVLTELYTLLRNPTVMQNPLSAEKAVGVIQKFRSQPNWRLIENAPIMADVWVRASVKQFPRRRIYDLRTGLTLIHHGVREFATVNVKDFHNLGFEKVWNPLSVD